MSIFTMLSVRETGKPIRSNRVGGKGCLECWNQYCADLKAIENSKSYIHYVEETFFHIEYSVGSIRYMAYFSDKSWTEED